MNGKKEEAMGVSRRTVVAAVALVAALALAIPVLARPDRLEVVISQTSLVGTTPVQIGTYEMVIDGNKVSFVQRRKVVAETTGEWKKADKKAPSTFFAYGADGRITEIHLGGHDSYLALQ
jgi:hypothetical protein